MLRWERKIVDFIERNLHIFGFLLLTFVLWYMRKGVYFHEVFDLESTLVTGNEGFYHTVGYELLLGLLVRLPLRPVLSIKTTVVLFDFFVALMAMWICRECSSEKDRSELPLVCYGVLAVSPLVIEYGSVWNHLDCVGMFLVLLAYKFHKFNLDMISGALLGLAASLFGVYLFVAIAWVIGEKIQKRGKVLLVMVGTLLTVLCVGAVMLDRTGVEVLASYFNFLVKNPCTGEVFKNMLELLQTLILRCGYVIGVLSVLYCFWGKKRKFLGAIIHVVLICFVGLFLQYGYWWL